MADAESMSKSAKKRAAKKARDEAYAAEQESKEQQAAAAAALQAPAKSKSKAKAKSEPAVAPAPAAAPAAAPAGKAKAKGKAEPAPAAAKGKAKAEPKAAEPAPAPAAAAPAAPKKKKAPKAEPAPEQPAVKKLIETDYVNYELDDGSGPAWETLPTKKEKRKSKPAEEAAPAEEAPAAAASPTKKDKKKAEKAEKDESWNKDSWEGWGEDSWSKDWKGGDSWNNKGSWDWKNQEAAEKAKADVAAILKMTYQPELDPKYKKKQNNKKEGASPKEGEEGDEKKEGEEEEDNIPKVTVTVKVPDGKVGACIGPKGATVKMLQTKAGVKIDTNGSNFVITGPEENVPIAEKAIKELSQKGYCSLGYENFTEGEVEVHSSHFPDIIGKQGATINTIKDKLNLIIKTQDAPKQEGAKGSGKGGGKGKVLLAGSAADVEKAKTVINNIVMYGHDELTHPGQTHEEMDVEKDLFKFIVGRAGQELRHIQNNWKVRVAMPRENSANDKIVITGEPKQVEQAKAHIDKLIVNAEKKGQNKEDGDHFGGDDEVDPAAEGYLVKR